MKLPQIIYASKKSPVLVWLTCGKISRKIIKRKPVIRKWKNRYNGHKRKEVIQKRWQRIIKKEQVGKTIYFSYEMVDCIRKKHKLSVRRKPFSSKILKQGGRR